VLAGGFQDMLAEARATLHSHLSLPATYRDPGAGTVEIPTSARLMRVQPTFGDLDRQGFAQVVEDVNQLVLDTDDVPEPTEKARVNVIGHGVFRIDAVQPADGRFRTCNVIRVRE
jgi:hypothetical protein